MSIIKSTKSRVLAAAGIAVVAGLVLTGCTSSDNDNLTKQYGSGTTQNYISGDGAVTEIAQDKRSGEVSFHTEDLNGHTVSSAALKGKVVVLNFWYAGCPPCRAESKYLVQSWKNFAGKDVVYIGVNVKDEADTAKAFDRGFKIPYPTVLDANTGTMQLALSGTIAPNSVPSTIVLDKQGRVAARVLGAIDSQSILDTLVSDELHRNAA